MLGFWPECTMAIITTDLLLTGIRRDDVFAMKGMLLRHTDPNALNALGNPALTQAARDQSWKVFDALRTAPDVLIDAPNARNETALM